MDIPTHIIVWAIFNGLSIISAFASKGESPITAGALSAAIGVLSVALVAGGESGFFLSLEVARWVLMAGIALMASVVTVGPETEKLVAPMVVSASFRLVLAAVTWLYML